MKLTDFKAITETLKYNEIVTVQYRSNWAGKKSYPYGVTGEFAWLSEDGERIKLWNRDRPIGYRVIISIAREDR